VHAAAPGYVAKSVPVTFNANVTLDISLERQPPPPAPPPPRYVQKSHAPEPVHAKADPPRTEPATQPPPPPPVTPPVAPPELVKPPGDIGLNPVKPRRPIDPSNPYETPHGDKP
jgi:hypothetical protein